MPLPKRRHSSSRRDKRRSQHKLKDVLLQKCKVTGAMHEPHKAYWVNDKMYYRGHVVVDKSIN